MGLCDTSRAYIKIQQNTHGGYDAIPADPRTFSQAQGVGRRLEPDLVPMPLEVADTSAAISLKTIAEELSAIRKMMEDKQ